MGIDRTLTILSLIVAVVALCLTEPFLTKVRTRSERSARKRLAQITAPGYVERQKHNRDVFLMFAGFLLLARMLHEEIQLHAAAADEVTFWPWLTWLASSLSVMLLLLAMLLLMLAMTRHMAIHPRSLAKERADLERKLNISADQTRATPD